MDAKDDQRRATFILRLSTDRGSAWHGVVELVDGQRRGQVRGADDLAAFIDGAFADPPPTGPDRTGEPMGGTSWN
jgi:hypothetical protein